MKLAYSTRNVDRPSFAGLCRLGYDYGMAGFEIYDAVVERKRHADSVLRTEKISEGKNMLSNRGLEVSALMYPVALDNAEASVNALVQYVDMASLAGIEFIVVTVEGEVDPQALKTKYADAVSRAESQEIGILFETVGPLCASEKLLAIINCFRSTVIGASWNTRGTFFGAGESAETTIKTLGAYIRYVRLGDRNGDADCLIGEGSLPVDKFLNALRSLNYEGFVVADWNSEVQDADIVLTHYENFISRVTEKGKKSPKLQENRSKTGTFPWKKYEVIDATFGDVLDTMAETYPDQYAFKFTTLDYTRTYSQFRRDVDQMAASLISMGVKPGYKVAIWATNVPAWFLTFWATTRIGAVLVTVNTAYQIHEAEYLLRQSDTHTLVMVESYKDSNYKQIMEELCPELKGHKKGEPLYAEKLPFLRNIVTVGFDMEGAMNWEQMLERSDRVPMAEVRRRASMVKAEDVCNMQYTSGTTGFPKGVMLTHRNIVNNGKTIGDRMDMSTADRMMIQVPMFHCFGMVLSMTSMMTHGGTLSPIPYFSPKSSLACINQEKITCFNGVPTMYIAMFNHEDFAKTDFSYMRTGIMAGANCPADLMRRASVEMHMTEILSVYGETESSPGCTMGEVNEDLDHRVETVGSAFPGVECKIIDPETGADLPDGQNGEFVARGFNIMKGYYKMPEATAQTIDADGWLHTGDICCRTPDGYYKVTGRLKDMIIRGGENIYPREIEEACAWVVLHEGQTADEKEMKDYGYASMAKHKVPRYFMFVPDFPMNAAGKILKYKMKEQSEKMLGLV